MRRAIPTCGYEITASTDVGPMPYIEPGQWVEKLNLVANVFFFIIAFYYCCF